MSDALALSSAEAACSARRERSKSEACPDWKSAQVCARGRVTRSAWSSTRGTLPPTVAQGDRVASRDANQPRCRIALTPGFARFCAGRVVSIDTEVDPESHQSAEARDRGSHRSDSDEQRHSCSSREPLPPRSIPQEASSTTTARMAKTCIVPACYELPVITALVVSPLGERPDTHQPNKN